MILTSIRVRLTAWFSGILGLTLVVAGIGVRLGIQDSIHDTVDKDLHSRLAGMRAYLEKQTGDPDSGPLSEELEEQGSMMPAGAHIRIAANDGNWIYQSETAKQWGAQISGPGRLPANGKTRTIVANGANSIQIDGITAAYPSQFTVLSNGWQPGKFSAA